MIHHFAVLIGLLLVLITLPGTFELCLLTIAGILPRRRARPPTLAQASPLRTIAVVIPAHDEERGIVRCVNSVAACVRPAGLQVLTVVVADNCSDRTAELAREAGARVMVRIDDHRRGKGYALNYAFEILLREGVDAMVVIDADTVSESNLLVEITRILGSGADGVQARYGVLNPTDSIRTRLMNVALMAFNVLRPRGRDRLGLSAGILGNGFALTRETLLAVPYDAHSVVEDLEYHLRLVRAGRRIRFADASGVRADMPVGGRGSETQRTRWEGGRARMIRTEVPALLRDIAGGNLRLFEPLLDLLLLPLAYHVTLLAGAIILPGPFSRLYGLMALGIVAGHVIAGIIVGRGTWRDLTIIPAIPVYVMWKLILTRRIMTTAQISSTWNRTKR